MATQVKNQEQPVHQRGNLIAPPMLSSVLQRPIQIDPNVNDRHRDLCRAG